MDTGGSDAQRGSTRVANRFAHTRLGALGGAGVGVLIAAALLILSLQDGEAFEGATLWAQVVASPLALIFERIGGGAWALSWPTFIALAVPLNGLLLGSLVGTALSFTSATRRDTLVAVVTVWSAIVTATLVLMLQ